MDFEIPAMSQGLRHDSLALPFANFYLSRRDNLGQHNNVRQSTHTFLVFCPVGIPHPAQNPSSVVLQRFHNKKHPAD